MKFIGLLTVASLTSISCETLSVLQLDLGQNKPIHGAPHKKISERLDAMSETTASFAAMAQSSIEDPLKIPTDDILRPVLQQFVAMKNGILEEKNVNQDLVNNANDVVVQCNADRNDHFTKANGIADQASAVGQARSQHKTCRQEESTADNEAKAAHQAFLDSLSCEPSSEWFAAIPDSCTPGLADVVSKAKDSEAKKNDFSTKQGDCDEKQTQFESDFCVYAASLEDVCANYDACYTQAVKSKNMVKADVQKLETSHKQLFLGVEKCECYIDVIKAARSRNLTQNDIEKCSQKTLTTTDLDVDYPATAGKENCDTDVVKNKPGNDEWKSHEYSDFAQEALEPVTACLVPDVGPEPFYYFEEGVARGAYEGMWGPDVKVNAYAGVCIEADSPDPVWSGQDGKYPLQVPKCLCQLTNIGWSGGVKECVEILLAPASKDFAAVFYNYDNKQCMLNSASGSTPESCPAECNVEQIQTPADNERSPKRDGGVRMSGNYFRSDAGNVKMGCFVKPEFAATEDDINRFKKFYA